MNLGDKVLVTLTPPQFGYLEGTLAKGDVEIALGISLTNAKQIRPPGNGLPIGDCFIPWTSILLLSWGPLPDEDRP
jgi:hypothetical protein